MNKNSKTETQEPAMVVNVSLIPATWRQRQGISLNTRLVSSTSGVPGSQDQRDPVSKNEPSKQKS